MKKKLTLSINERVIDRAKEYANQTGRSLSEIIESYLEKITAAENIHIDDDLDKVFGIIELPESFDEKKAMRDIRYRKHLGQ